MIGTAQGFVQSAQRHVSEAATELGLAVAALQAIELSEPVIADRLDHLIASMTAQKHLVANHVDLIAHLASRELSFREDESAEGSEGAPAAEGAA